MRRFFTRRMLEVRSHAMRRGLLGGDHRWLALYGAFVTVGIVRRIGAHRPVVERFVLAPGQTLVITDTGSEHATSPS